ncbi:allophanate hydrolase subunit 2 [Oceaniovalibus guishaninsula JLT2003]|uniref:Allophanate hydrolase subunit 2 n=1 Tax=Oceaniovalibus guishaninsula JLT2003 TaxID=1231392 RepID=K2H9Z0_9RHOB|nr:biotin-dependent carboxyltransferase family protein [Oceaniovalibus guishaninsula]EKE44363.1 allophanate hydrolase subunit 2 [Oceaniovalibus guishaninsula JLT2003]
MRALIVHRIGAGCSVQDRGRTGWLAQGLSRGGAADRLALAEGAALLGQPPDLAALELTGAGGTFEATEPMRVALTGARAVLRLGDKDLPPDAVHRVEPGARFSVGAARGGVFAYLNVGGGIDVPPVMGSRAAHLALALGPTLQDGTRLPVGADPGQAVNRGLDPEARLGGGDLRMLPSAHTALFAQDDLARFAATPFVRDPRGNRQGVRLEHDGAPFATQGQLTLLSEVIVPGDVQMTGDGTPYILGPEAQTIGGYPRIGCILPADLPRAMQAAPGDVLRFRFVTPDEALATWRDDDALMAALRARVRPITRDPRDMPDLLSYQLIGGVTSGTPEEEQ